MPRSTLRPATVSDASSVARPAFSRWVSARRVARGSSGSTARASTGTPTATITPRAGWYTSRPTQTATTVSAAALKRETASTNQPIFSTSPVDTATTSPAATRRVRAEPSSAVRRARSCWTRAAAVIQLVTAVRCSMASPSAMPSPHNRRSPPVWARRAPERSTTAWTAKPTQKGSPQTDRKCSSPQARDLS
ncbi:hypothetical protein MBT84_06580 [Streptomyces sp. MBT84]|nr:hypothetical protein [Streptomyces sp. MBT84]